MRFLLATICLIITGTTLMAQSYPPLKQQKTHSTNKICNQEESAPSEGCDAKNSAERQTRTQQASRHPSKEEINAQKIAFFTQELNLTPQEAEKFWPIYHESWRERGKARHNTMDNLNKLNKASEDPEITDTQIQALSDAYIKCFKREGEIYIAYFNNFKKVLPLRKAVKVFSAEEKFRVILIKQLRGNK